MYILVKVRICCSISIPGQIRDITSLSREAPLHNKKGTSRQEANATNNNVSYSQKVIFASEPGARAQHHMFLPIKPVCIVAVFHCNCDVCALWQICVDAAPKLPEIRESCCAHPYNEVLIGVDRTCTVTSTLEAALYCFILRARQNKRNRESNLLITHKLVTLSEAGQAEHAEAYLQELYLL